MKYQEEVGVRNDFLDVFNLTQIFLENTEGALMHREQHRKLTETKNSLVGMWCSQFSSEEQAGEDFEQKRGLRGIQGSDLGGGVARYKAETLDH